MADKRKTNFEKSEDFGNFFFGLEMTETFIDLPPWHLLSCFSQLICFKKLFLTVSEQKCKVMLISEI